MTTAALTKNLSAEYTTIAKMFMTHDAYFTAAEANDLVDEIMEVSDETLDQAFNMIALATKYGTEYVASDMLTEDFLSLARQTA